LLEEQVTGQIKMQTQYKNANEPGKINDLPQTLYIFSSIHSKLFL